MSEAPHLGDVKMAYLEPFDNGKRALFTIALKKTAEINGRTTDHLAFVFEEQQLLELTDGLTSTAEMRKSADYAKRLIEI